MSKQHAIAPVRVSAANLRGFIERVLVSCDLPAGDAATIAGLMCEADLCGADGHGVFRLPQYVRRIRAGGMNPRPTINVIEARPAMAVLDGDNGFGHLVMKKATELAMEKASTAGVAWVGSRFSNHAGPASLYARMPLKKDMIGLYLAVGSANHLPPWGGTEMLLSTNPIAVAVPSGQHPPIVLDMATTVAAYGKIKTAAQRGESIPEGWMIDRLGQPLTDPKRSGEGFLLPIGGAKGYGLALIFGILAGTLNGAALGKDVVDFNADDHSVTNTGQAILVLDIAAFCDVEEFKSDIDRVWDSMKGSDKLPGFDEIRLPGERLAKVRADREVAGVPVAPELMAELNELADKTGVAHIQPRNRTDC